MCAASNQNPEQVACDNIDNLPEPEILADEIIENIEAGPANFRAVAGTLFAEA